MAEQAVLLEQFAGDMRAIMEQCDEIKRKLEDLEEEEDARDQQANLGPPVHTFPGSNHSKYFPSIDEDYYPMNIDMEEEYALETDCFSYYCGDDGIDADDAFCTASDDESNEGMVDCMNDQLKEHFCSHRDCHWFGCRATGHEVSSMSTSVSN